MLIGLAVPSGNVEYFYKHADADKLIFLHYGIGTRHTMFGELPFLPGD